MATNTRYKTRIQHNGAEDWKLEFLLHGRASHSSIPGRQSVLPFCWNPALGGCLCNPSVWRPLWEDLRPGLLRVWTKKHPGTRPWAWWRADAPEPLLAGEDELSFLARHGLLTAAEKASRNRTEAHAMTFPTPQK
jgi:hypothetical protein